MLCYALSRTATRASTSSTPTCCAWPRWATSSPKACDPDSQPLLIILHYHPLHRLATPVPQRRARTRDGAQLGPMWFHEQCEDGRRPSKQRPHRVWRHHPCSALLSSRATHGPDSSTLCPGRICYGRCHTQRTNATRMRSDTTGMQPCPRADTLSDAALRAV